jgi:hypothetical protein
MITTVLRQLIAAGAVSRVTFRATSGGYILCVRIGLDEQILEAQRGGARIFRTLDAGARFIHGLGLGLFETDLAKFSQARALV